MHMCILEVAQAIIQVTVTTCTNLLEPLSISPVYLDELDADHE